MAARRPVREKVVNATRNDGYTGIAVLATVVLALALVPLLAEKFYVQFFAKILIIIN